MLSNLIFFKFRNEKAQMLLEYALILFLIAVVVILSLKAVSPEIGNAFSEIGATLE